MKRQLIILLCLIGCLSCVLRKNEVIAKSTIKLEGRNTNIRDLLDIDGVFGSSLIFFDDGLLANPIMKGRLNEDNIEDMSTSVWLWKEERQTGWGDCWGVYTIRHDTIIAHVYQKATWHSSWDLFEKRYKIINRKTIQLFYSYSLLLTESDKEYLANQNITPWVDVSKNTISFTPIDSISTCNSWLKEEKWIWRDESDWKAYMDRMKREEEKKK